MRSDVDCRSTESNKLFRSKNNPNNFSLFKLVWKVPERFCIVSYYLEERIINFSYILAMDI